MAQGTWRTELKRRLKLEVCSGCGVRRKTLARLPSSDIEHAYCVKGVCPANELQDVIDKFVADLMEDYRWP